MPRGYPNPKYFSLHERLRRARKAAGLRPSVLSLAAGLSNTNVAAIEGRRVRAPGLDTVERIARTLNVSPAWLAYGVEGPPLPASDGPLACQGIGARLEMRRDLFNRQTQVELGKAAGLSHTAISDIERGRSMPTVATAERLAAALGVRPAWLAFREGDWT